MALINDYKAPLQIAFNIAANLEWNFSTSAAGRQKATRNTKNGESAIDIDEWLGFLTNFGLLGPQLTMREARNVFVQCNLDDEIYEQDDADNAADWIVYDEFTECVSRVAAAWTDDWDDAEFAGVMEDYLSREMLPKLLSCTLFEMTTVQQEAFHRALGKHDGSVQHVHGAVHVHDDGEGHLHACDHVHVDGDPRHYLVEMVSTHEEGKHDHPHGKHEEGEHEHDHPRGKHEEGEHRVVAESVLIDRGGPAASDDPLAEHWVGA
jgi:hypothetical protein